MSGDAPLDAPVDAALSSAPPNSTPHKRCIEYRPGLSICGARKHQGHVVRDDEDPFHDSDLHPLQGPLDPSTTYCPACLRNHGPILRDQERADAINEAMRLDILRRAAEDAG